MSADRLRIVYLASTLRRAGPTSVLLDIVRHLDAALFEPDIVTLSREPADSMQDAFRDTSARIRSFSMSRLRAQLHRSWRRDLGRLLGKELDGRCIVHSHGLRADVVSSSSLTGVRRLSTAHNEPYADYPMKYGPIAGRWMAARHLRALRSLPVVVACSATLAERLRPSGVAARFIRNGVDTTRFRRPDPLERTGLRERLGLARDARVGVCVGTMSPRKQPLDVVRATRALDDPSLVMIFVGSGIQEADCRREAGGDRRIQFAGQVSDVAPIVRAADFFVSASRAEGLPVAALEAIACGLNVVLSDIEPHRELLQIAPAAGSLFPAGDREALAQAIRRAVAESAQGDAGAEVPTDELGALRMSQRYQALYLALASEPPHG